MPITELSDGLPSAPALSPNDALDPLVTLRGNFLIGSRSQNDQSIEKDVPLGWLTVRPAEEEPGAPPGQWVLRILPEMRGRMSASFFIRLASRLGIVPVQLASNFAAALANESPMALVADTNALRYGLLSQALRARGGRATHVAVADQAYMEIHRQRDRAYERPDGLPTPEAPRRYVRAAPPDLGKGDPRSETPTRADETSHLERWRRVSDRCVHLAAAARALRRVRDDGHLVHVARPPDAKVRYLGGSTGSASADAENGMQGTVDGGSSGSAEVASNLVRDRLVLEAVFQQMVELPSVPVWLVTSDASLAEQAHMEGLLVGFGWLADRLEPPLITSPTFDPRSLQLRHVPLRHLLEEIVWSCGVVTLQKQDEGKRLVGSVPSGSDKRWRALAALEEPGHGVSWKQEPAPLLPASRVGGHPSARAGLPRKAPTPQVLLGRLLTRYGGAFDTSGGSSVVSEGASTADAYLRELGWIDASGGCTERGRVLAEKWLGLQDTAAEGWIDWMYDAVTDVGRVSTLQQSLRCLKERPGATDTEISAVTGDAERTVQAQLGLASAFGAAVRLGNKNWLAAAWNDDEAAEAVLDAVGRVASQSTIGAASIARTFTSFLGPAARPMPMPVFRRALLRLRATGRVQFSGSSPESSGVKVRVLVRDATGSQPVEIRTIDLGYGDFLLPGTPCAAAMLPEATR
jgi:hypothetical protein